MYDVTIPSFRPRAPWLTVTLAALALLAHSAAASAREAPQSFADLAARLLPSVVNISTTAVVKGPERGMEMPQFPPGSPFEEFFKNFMERQGQGGQGRPDAPPRKATSLGSGFIIDATGYIVTNNHVIADAEEISVTLHDDTVFKATLTGRDPKTDLAVLKIDPGKTVLKAVPFGNSDAARVGDWVMAIGNPFGLGGTVTAGIVSARARDINSGPYDDFIQTDASINKGNSGGPLFNLDGEVVGINSAIYSPSGGSIGIGFSIPSSLAKPVIEDLKKFGKTRRGWLGVRIQSVDKELAESMALPEVKGALVAAVDAGGPAAKAGLKPGDVILKFDGKDVNEMRRLPRIVAETAIGGKVPVDVWRDGKKIALDVVVGELKDDPQDGAKTSEAPNGKPTPGNAPTAIPGAGLSVAALTPALREKFDIDPETKGVVVTDVDPAGPVADKGLRPGDVIIEAAQTPVTTPADLVKAVEKARAAGAKFLRLRVENPQSLRYVPLPLAEKKK